MASFGRVNPTQVMQKMDFSKLSAKFKVNNVVIGGGIASGAILKGLAKTPNPGKVLAITRGDRWPMAFQRHFLLGQSRQNLTVFPGNEFRDPKGRMTVDEHMREVVSYQIQAVEPFNGNDIDCLETDAMRVFKMPDGGVMIQCADGTLVESERVFIATGVGPERTLESSHVLFENQPSPKRGVFHEVTTALKSMQENPEYWQNKAVTVYGGGATAAWVIECAMAQNLRDIHWIAKEGFGGANPGNRNADTLQLTKNHRVTASILKLKYEGEGDTPPNKDGLKLTLEEQHGKTGILNTDIVVCATGSDPLAPTGIQSVLGDLYKSLVPKVGKNSGVFAYTPDSSIYVVSSALTQDVNIQKLIREKTFSVLNPENHVVAGLAATHLSAQDTIEWATEKKD
jgi:hypothetical protein